MRHFTNRRLVLLVIMVAAIAGNLWWWRAEEVSEDAALRKAAAFHLDLTQRGIVIPKGKVKHLPLFDPSKGKWLSNGQENDTLLPLVYQNDPQFFHPESRGIVIIGLPEGGGANQLRQSIVALAKERICTFAVAGPGIGQPEENGDTVVDIYYIRDVRTDSGSVVQC